MKYRKIIISSIFLLLFILCISLYMNFTLLEDEKELKHYVESLSYFTLTQIDVGYKPSIEKGRELNLDLLIMYNNIALEGSSNIVSKDELIEKILNRSEKLKILFDDILAATTQEEEKDKIKTLYQYAKKELDQDERNKGN